MVESSAQMQMEEGKYDPDTNGEPSDPKHEALAKEEHEGVEVMENKFVQNVVNPFIHHSRSWEDEEMKIPEGI